MATTGSQQSAGEMMSDILGSVGNLVGNEVDLARVEFAESVGKARTSITAMAVALVFAITGLNLVAASIVTVVIWGGLPPHLAIPAVGVGFLLLALIVFYSAKSALNQIGFLPTRTARSLKRDVAAIKDPLNVQA